MIEKIKCWFLGHIPTDKELVSYHQFEDTYHATCKRCGEKLQGIERKGRIITNYTKIN